MFIRSAHLNEVRRRTAEIPVVFIATNDPVGLGIVKSLSHPGGNLTGFMLYEVTVAGKFVELLKEMVPRSCKSGSPLLIPNNSSAELVLALIKNVARCRIGVISGLVCMTPPASKMRIDTFTREPNGGLVLPTDVTIIAYRDLIVEQAARHRLPVVYSFRSVVAVAV